MHVSKIEAAAVNNARPSLDLFSVSKETKSMIGTNPKPRQATVSEIMAYAEWLALSAGLAPLAVSEIIGCAHERGRKMAPAQGVTYGASTKRGRDVEWQEGAFSVAFPGRNAHRDRVTLETLDEAGEVVASSTLPLEPKKGGVIWDKAAVRKACGVVGRKCPPIPSPAASEASPAPEEQEANNTVPRVDEPAAPPPVEMKAVAEQPQAPSELADRVATLEAMVHELLQHRAAPPVSMESQEPVAQLKRSPTHERAIRRAWAARATARQLTNRLVIAQQDIREGERMLAMIAKQGTRHLERRRRVTALARARKPARWYSEKHMPAVAKLADDFAGEATARERAEAELQAFKRLMPDSSTPARPEDLARLIDERDAARRELATLREKASHAARVQIKVADALEEMTGRALRAESALKAREALPRPFIVKRSAVTFAEAA
jgi:hypothetical protein